MSFGLLNLKFILVRKAKFSSKFNYIDFIFLKNLSAVVKRNFYVIELIGFISKFNNRRILYFKFD